MEFWHRISRIWFSYFPVLLWKYLQSKTFFNFFSPVTLRQTHGLILERSKKKVVTKTPFDDALRTTLCRFHCKYVFYELCKRINVERNGSSVWRQSGTASSTAHQRITLTTERIQVNAKRDENGQDGSTNAALKIAWNWIEILILFASKIHLYANSWLCSMRWKHKMRKEMKDKLTNAMNMHISLIYMYIYLLFAKASISKLNKAHPFQ